ncbi:hypothetical protein ACHAWF_004948 [Thalassiosira exigua]
MTISIPSPGPSPTTHRVPLGQPLSSPPRPSEVDLGTMSEDDLDELARSDPFLYRSIPGVHEAKLSLRDVDHSQVLSPRRSEEENEGPEPDNSKASAPACATKVARRTRFSTECHYTLALEDLLSDMPAEDEFDVDDLRGAIDDDVLEVLSVVVLGPTRPSRRGEPRGNNQQ